MAQRLIFVTRGLHDKGGIERVTSYIASLLSSDEREIEIICLQKKGVPCYPISSRVKITYLSDLKGCGRIGKLRNYYKKRQPDLIILVGSNRSLSHWLPTRGFRCATWEHFNTLYHAHPLHTLDRFLATRMGWIIALTEADAEAYRKEFRTQRVIAISNPLSVEGIEPSSLTNKRILSVGRLSQKKGFDLLLLAWAKIAPLYPDWQLRIVGSGRLQKALEQEIQRLHIERAVSMIAHTNHIATEYREASIYAMSSRLEGFGLVLLEAMAAGLPTVSFDCPRGPKEIIQHEETGLLVPNGDVEGLASALQRLIENPNMRASMAQKALERITLYAPEKIQQQWIKALQQMTL